MKKLNLILILCIFILQVNAQTTQELFSDNNYSYYWYGVDYSNVKLIGDFTTPASTKVNDHTLIRDRYFKSWNDLIVRERNKFSVETMLHKEPVIYKTGMIDSINFKIQVDSLEGDVGRLLEDKLVVNSISNYNLIQNQGVGIVLIAEYMDKIHIKASHILVVFNIESREILLKERFETIPVGFGMRNYWAGAIYKIFKEVKNKRYKAWKKIYTKS